MRSVDRLSVLLDLATVLHVDVEALTGRSWHDAPKEASVVDEAEPIRRVLDRYDVLTDARRDDQKLPSSDRLSAHADEIHRLYQDARYVPVIRALPELLQAADRLHLAGDPEFRLAYVSAYVVAAKLLTKLGSTDLAGRAADRAAVAAGVTGSLEAQGMAIFQVACTLLQSGRTAEAESLAVAMAERSTASVRPARPSLASTAGALWLIAALAAGRRADRTQASRWLDEADRLAQVLGRDANHGWTAFGPTNVAIHRVSVAAKVGDAAAATEAAAAVDVDRLPPGLRSRRAQTHVDLAWAEAKRKRDAEATLHLLEVEREAPAALRYNVLARETLWELLSRQRRRSSRVVTDLAARAGALDRQRP